MFTLVAISLQALPQQLVNEALQVPDALLSSVSGIGGSELLGCHDKSIQRHCQLIHQIEPRSDAFD